MSEINLMYCYPRSKRPLDDRARLVTDEHRRIAKRFEKEYFDGDRLTGYGGYNYHPRFWQDTVRRFRDHYQLKPDASVLDVGCAKGFMLHDFKELMPDLTIAGVDVSQYALDHAMPDVRPYMQLASAAKLPFADKSFDLVLAINTVHNLPRGDCMQALREMRRVSNKSMFLVVDAWRNEQERQNLMTWILTAQCCMHVDDWKVLFQQCGYDGDYTWFILE